MLLIELIRRPTAMGDLWSRSERKLAVRESSMYMELLAHYGDLAIRRLAEEIRRGAEQAGKLDSWLARAFVRFGSDALKAVLPWLNGKHEALTLAALELIRVFGEGRMRVLRLDPRHWRRITEPELFLLSREACDAVVHESRIDCRKSARTWPVKDYFRLMSTAVERNGERESLWCIHAHYEPR